MRNVLVVCFIASFAACSVGKSLSRPDETPAADHKPEAAKQVAPVANPQTPAAAPAAPAQSPDQRIAEAQRREKESLEATKAADERAKAAALEKRVKEAEERAREAEERRKEAEARAKAAEQSRAEEEKKNKEVLGENKFTEYAAPGNDVLVNSPGPDSPLLVYTGEHQVVWVNELPEGRTRGANTRNIHSLGGIDLINLRSSGKPMMVAMPTIIPMEGVDPRFLFRAHEDGSGLYFKQYGRAGSAIICDISRACMPVMKQDNGTYLVTVTLQGNAGSLTRQMHVVNTPTGRKVKDVLVYGQEGIANLWSGKTVEADGYTVDDSMAASGHNENKKCTARTGRIYEGPVRMCG